MTGFDLSTSRPDAWDRLDRASDALFGTGPWLDLLEQSFGCRTLFATDGSDGIAISVFRGGPFKVGYLGFPIGGGFRGNSSVPSLVATLRSSDLGGLPTCVRMAVSAFDDGPEFDLPYASNPETVIVNLQDWRLESVSKNLRRDVRKAQRSALQVTEATDADAGDSLYEIYSQTVKRHGGALRYNATYFRRLIRLSIEQPRLTVLLARQGSDIAGFVVTVLHQDTAYYLHGGADPEYRASSPSDLLVNHAIHHARQEGGERFNLMASPPDQASLLRYKEKWGGVTRELRTYTLPTSSVYPLFKITEKIYGLFR